MLLLDEELDEEEVELEELLDEELVDEVDEELELEDEEELLEVELVLEEELELVELVLEEDEAVRAAGSRFMCSSQPCKLLPDTKRKTKKRFSSRASFLSDIF